MVEPGRVLRVKVHSRHARADAFFNDTASTEIYTGEDSLSLHVVVPVQRQT
eukprot:COSAG05_NODE_11036_length_534_cov_0.533333_1_plen_50_part_01